MLKYPKKPKQSAPLSSWERYDARVKEVDKINADKKKEAQNAIKVKEHKRSHHREV